MPAPEPPLTAAIALSILFLGPEMVRSQRGRRASPFATHGWWHQPSGSCTVRFRERSHHHGAATGRDPLALLLFNLGVEAGQILFVMVLLLERSFRMLEVRLLRLIEALPAYTVGSLGAFLDDSARGHHARRRTMKGL